jgi:FAD/FMN-containing dehydrogenase
MWLTAEHGDYETARVIFSRQQMRHPAVIARCADVADVQAALRFARERDLEIAVRCGGHHAAGWSSVEGGLVIDLRLMRSVRVDPQTRTAWIGGGTLAGELVREAAKFGLTGVTGITHSVGLGGLLLHLGEGYLTPKYGYGTDQIEELEMVTAATRNGRRTSSSASTPASPPVPRRTRPGSCCGAPFSAGRQPMRARRRACPASRPT